MVEPLSVVLAGVHGHGRWHLRNLRRATAAGVPVRLAGICDPRPVPSGDTDGADVPVAADLAALLRRVRADVVIVCTPIHTHAELALVAAGAGAHVLLEKPPTATLAGFDELVAGLDAAGTACQVGFQSLGSHAIGHVRAGLAAGRIGAVTGIGASGAWQRDRGYYERARWAGRRTLDGVPVVDGALTNPFAHAVATALALDGARGVSEVAVELFRANDIDADDTSCVHLVTDRGTPVAVAATLCADRPVDPSVVVHGTAGRVTLDYLTGRVRWEAGGRVEVTGHRATDLLDNLVAHLLDPGVELLVPPAVTRPFMQVLDAVRLAPAPVPIPETDRFTDRSGPHPREVVPRAADLVAEVAARLVPLSALVPGWDRPVVPEGGAAR